VLIQYPDGLSVNLDRRRFTDTTDFDAKYRGF
jgi:hypothetical protein